MIKKLFFVAALLAPNLAYAGNPSTDLSVQVVPPGDPPSKCSGSANCMLLGPGTPLNSTPTIGSSLSPGRIDLGWRARV